MLVKAVLQVQSLGLQLATGRQVEIKQIHTESAVKQDSKTQEGDFRQKTDKEETQFKYTRKHWLSSRDKVWSVHCVQQNGANWLNGSRWAGGGLIEIKNQSYVHQFGGPKPGYLPPHMLCCMKCNMDMWHRVSCMCGLTALHSLIDGIFYVTPSV